MPVRKSLPQWPNPQDSIGRQIPCSRVGGRTVWWPQGPALKAFEELIQPKIESNLQRIDLGHTDLFIRLYMIGRTPENANPIVMVCCTNSEARDAAEAAIRECGLLSEHKGFGLGAAALPLEHPAPVRRLSPRGRQYSTSSGGSAYSSEGSTLSSISVSSESTASTSRYQDPLSLTQFSRYLLGYTIPADEILPLTIKTSSSSTTLNISNAGLAIFASTAKPVLGRRIYNSNNRGQSLPHYQHVTAGIVIEVDGNYCQLTAGHAFEAESESLGNGQLPISLDECRFDGQSDDGRYDLGHESEMTRRGSATPEEAGSWNGSTSGSPSEETMNSSDTDSKDSSPVRRIHSTSGKGSEVPETLPNTNPGILIGYLPLDRSFRTPIDYAIIAIPRSSVEGMGQEINALKPNLRVTSIAKVGYAECGVLVATHSAIIRATLIPGEVTYRGYQTPQFKKLVQVELESEVFSGDCGSPVVDESTGSLYGHIIMGVPGTKIAYIVQAFDIFQDIKAKVGCPAIIATAQYINAKAGGSALREREPLDSTALFYTTPGDLPCEFVGYSRCDQTFTLDEIDAWVEHIVSGHLRGHLPAKVRCWFCDEFILDAEHAGGRLLNFQQRMWHIRGHILDGFSVNEMRPDYYFNEHLHCHRLIPEHVYDDIRRWTKIPPSESIISHEEERRDRRHRHKSRKERR
ncbi:hypothetical protein O1611_g66 [Lasiodiplodia mahajangana]|uniref:Uncharacterized protein n=1 Tax=Lasiodiplodia mahajangana TaxID=1108764 RepID=A0ACC2K1U8_9PEZI|nr:hypothetical protein O1611_g66 [Lasiodiplodia mahajangana]